MKASRPVAREVIEKLIDDLDGSDAAETVTFGLDGAMFEIDLSKKNATAFRKSLDRYVKAARPSSPAASAARRKAPPSTNGPKARRKRPASTNGSKAKRDYDIRQLREWARDNKVAVPSRGRIPKSVVAQYLAAATSS